MYMFTCNMYICMYVYIYLHRCIYMYLYILGVYIHIYAYVCTYIYVCIDAFEEDDPFGIGDIHDFSQVGGEDT